MPLLESNDITGVVRKKDYPTNVKRLKNWSSRAAREAAEELELACGT
jgi:hypothetical protein